MRIDDVLGDGEGYLRVIETWGNGDAGEPEAAIVEAARQSTQGAFRGWTTDQKLLAHLYEHRHNSPFEFAGMTIEVSAPIMVFREWHRHRTQSYAEMSARYAPLPDIDYVPVMSRLFQTSNTNKQAQGTGATLTREAAQSWLNKLQAHYYNAENLYQEGLKAGVPKELARLALTFGRYSRMQASGNLRNWLAFLSLRMHTDAQWEIRQYANAVCKIMRVKFPRTTELFLSEFHRRGEHLEDTNG
jgi:thymidylate synthase (FAD)